MNGITTRNVALLAVLMTMVVAAPAQTQREREVLSVQGYPGQAAVIQSQGRTFVDVQDLARITNGTLRFDNGRIILTLDNSLLSGEKATKPGFSRAFMSAAIEAMASIREWGGMLLITVQNGYPVGNNMAGNTIAAYQERAADSVGLAAAAVSTESDYRGLDLLRNEFNNGQAWSDRFVRARSTLSAANMSMTEHAFEKDEEAQKLLRCGQFLAQMFASGTYQDDASCH